MRAAILIVTIAAVGYFGYMGWVGSDQLVHPPHPNADCRTPASLGWDYEAINYDQALDDQLHAEQADQSSCSSPGAPAGDKVVSSDGIKVAGWWIRRPPRSGQRGPPSWSSTATATTRAACCSTRSSCTTDTTWSSSTCATAASRAATRPPRGSLSDTTWRRSWTGWCAPSAPSQIAVFGQSMGGQTSINVVAHDPRVAALILDSTHDRLATAMVARIHNAGYPLGEVGYLAIALGTWIRTGENVLSEDPIEALPGLGARPVLLLQGGSDIDVPPASADRMAAAAKAAHVSLELHVCPSATHGHIDEECPKDYGPWLNDFLGRVLGT